MKKIIGIIFLAYSVNLFAIESNIFDEKYPRFQNYQLITFAQLRNYFEALSINSLVYTDVDGTKTYQTRLDTRSITIHSKIVREKTENQISERVSYFLENGNSIEYEIIKKGKKIIPSEDADLLTFNFKVNSEDEFYQITVPTFKIQMSHASTTTGEKDFFYLGFMEFTVQIESFFGEQKASLNYIYFFKDIMPSPQASITVTAIKTPSEWSGVIFVHSSSQSGEITPKQFFQGINMGAGAFVGGADAIFKMMIGNGFPKLN